MAEVTHPNDAELEPGQRVGEYVISHRLGKGGFGAVYAAQQPVIHKVVAIKVIAWRFASDREMISRFIAEARLVNEIRHHNIIDIFSFGCLPDGRHYYVMELLDGVTLDRRIADRRPLAMDEALTILRGIARALDAAHARGVVHRDLKPDNVFLLRDGTSWFPKLLDFGIAKLLDADTGIEHKTVSGIAVGTPTYMPPEQCRGQRVDHRADVYSLGVLAYRLLTGHLPFVASNAHDLVRMHVEVVPPLASARNPELDAHADRAIAAREGSRAPAGERIRGDRGARRRPRITAALSDADAGAYAGARSERGARPDGAREHAARAHAAQVLARRRRVLDRARRGDRVRGDA
jgi:serine/threonine protein kinase